MTHGGAPSEERPDCFRCRHFRVTWQPAWPYRCEAFAIRSRALPSLEVQRSSGEPCRAFEPKPRPADRRPR